MGKGTIKYVYDSTRQEYSILECGGPAIFFHSLSMDRDIMRNHKYKFCSYVSWCSLVG